MSVSTYLLGANALGQRTSGHLGLSYVESLTTHASPARATQSFSDFLRSIPVPFALETPRKTDSREAGAASSPIKKALRRSLQTTLAGFMAGDGGCNPAVYASIGTRLTPDELNPAFDAVLAAPQFHTVALENTHVRVLNVVVPPGTREPFHTHVWQSVFLGITYPALFYYTPSRIEALFTLPARSEIFALHLAPEGLHSLENRESYPLTAFRVELKHAPREVEENRLRGPIIATGKSGDQLSLDSSVFRLCLGNQLHGIHDASLPAVLISDPGGAGRVSWWNAARDARNIRPTDVMITMKYLRSCREN